MKKNHSYFYSTLLSVSWSLWFFKTPQAVGFGKTRPSYLAIVSQKIPKWRVEDLWLTGTSFICLHLLPAICFNTVSLLENIISLFSPFLLKHHNTSKQYQSKNSNAVFSFRKTAICWKKLNKCPWGGALEEMGPLKSCQNTGENKWKVLKSDGKTAGTITSETMSINNLKTTHPLICTFCWSQYCNLF